MKVVILLLGAFVALSSADIFDKSKEEHKEYTLLKANKHSVVLRAPRSISKFFRRMIGREKPAYSPSQAVNSAASSPSGVSFSSPFAAASSFYPSYAAAAYAPINGLNSQFAAAASAPSASFSTYPLPGNPYASAPGSPYMSAAAAAAAAQGLTAASSPYAAYSSPANGAASASPDFHAVLDSFVRSAGLTPAGSVPNDQEMAASSSITSKGDTPVFSFKKLYSFPFYLSSDNAPSTSGFALNIPYMKQHIRRMSIGSVGSKSKAAKAAAKKQKQIEEEHKKKDAALKQIQDQQRLIRALASSEAIASLLQQYLKGDQTVSLNSLRETEKRPILPQGMEGALSYFQPSLLQQQQQQQQQVPQSLQAKPANYQAFEYAVSPAQAPASTNDHLMQLQQIRQHLERQQQQLSSQQQQQQQQQQAAQETSSDSLSESSSIDSSRANAAYNSRVVTHDTQALHEIDPRLYDSSSSASSSSNGNPMYYQHQQVNSEGVKSNSAVLDYSNGDLMDSVRSPSNQDNDSGSLSVAESSYRPTIVAYYDPSSHHISSSSSSSSSSSPASISKISSSLPPVSSVSSSISSSSSSSSLTEPITGLASKKDLIISSLTDDAPKIVSLGSSYSMNPRGKF